jgi:DNA polymerase-3 subunit beta
VAIPIGRLLEITSNVKDVEIEFSLLGDNRVEIKTQSGTFSITGQNYQEFPLDPVMNESVSLSLNMESFLEIIDFTKNSVSKDDLKPALQGVLLKIDSSQILGVSTDGHRLSRMIIKNKNDQTKEHEIIVPIKFLTLLNSFIDKKDKIELEISENYISVSHKNQTIFSRIIKDTYPDYEKVVPLDNNKQLTINKENLIDSIKRVSIFSNRSTKQITLKINKQETTIQTEDAENAASGKETIQSEFSDENELKIGFNANFILEALNNINQKEITIFLNGPLSAAILAEKEEKTEKDKLLLLMPIRLND